MPRVFRPGTAALAFASALLPAAALAQVGGTVPPLPTFDVSAYCEMVGTSSGKSWNRHVCLKKEETAKADILPNWRDLLALNPLSGVVDGFRWCLLSGRTEIYLPGLGSSVVTAALLIVSGVWYFRRTERQFSDII